MTDRIDSLLAMLKAGQDTALLRFSLGSEYLAQQKYEAAIEHLKAAVKLDRNYSAAWKILGRALLAAGRNNEARSVYTSGIVIAQAKGDVQAAKEMHVFLKRLEKSSDSGGTNA